MGEELSSRAGELEALDSDRAVKKLVIGLGFMSVISASDMCNVTDKSIYLKK